MPVWRGGTWREGLDPLPWPDVAAEDRDPFPDRFDTSVAIV